MAGPAAQFNTTSGRAPSPALAKALGPLGFAVVPEKA
jgi:hypothetical protein